MRPTMTEYYQHREDPCIVIRVLKHDRGTITVSLDDPEATVFHLTREELSYNFEPVLENTK